MSWRKLGALRLTGIVAAVALLMLAVGVGAAAVTLPFTETVDPATDTEQIDVTVENLTDDTGTFVSGTVKIDETVDGSTTTVVSETVDSSVNNTETVSLLSVDQNATYDVTVSSANGTGADAVLVEQVSTTGAGGLIGADTDLGLIGIVVGAGAVVYLMFRRDN